MTELKNVTDFVYEESGKNVVRVQSDIDREVYDYFFHHVICYTHGSRKAIIAFFFQRFYEECQRQKIPRVWDETNHDKIVQILNRLNFNEPRPKSVRTRRTSISSPVDQTQPDG